MWYEKRRADFIDEIFGIVGFIMQNDEWSHKCLSVLCDLAGI